MTTRAWSARLWRRASGLLVVTAIIPATLAGQSVDAVIAGLVVDQTGAVVQGATITATHVATGVVRLATSDSTGQYRVAPLPAGVYNLRAELVGFRPQLRTGQVLHVGTVVTIDFTFDKVAAADAIEVSGDAPVLETTKNTLSRLIDKAEIDGLPVVDRNFNALASLTPGVTATGVYGGVDISGSRDFQNGYNVDGVSAEGLGAGDQRVAYAQDWIEEFQVLTSQYNPEFGRASGGIVNAITRSGSNLTTGRAYGFFRNEAWDATPVFATSKAALQLKRLGATTGGKLIANRLFFFGGAELFESGTSKVVNSSFAEHNGTVPATSNQKLLIAKIEHHPRDSTTYRLRYNADRRADTHVGVGGIRTEEHGLSSGYTANDIVGAWTQTVGGLAFNELRGAFNNTTSDTRCNLVDRNASAARFTLNYPTARLGCNGAGYGRRAMDELQLVDNISWTHGRHDLKAGAQVSRGRSHGDFRGDGVYSFALDLPFDLSNPATYPYSLIVFEGRTAWDYPRWSWGFFIQDGWRLTSDFTLNAGVRYDVDGSYTALNSMIRTDKGLTTVRKDLDNIAPRVGFAWTPFDNGKKTLVRGGAGLYHDENHSNLARLLLSLSILVDRSIAVNAFIPGLNPFAPDSARAQRFLAEALARNTIPDIAALPAVAGITPDLEHDLQVPVSVQTSAGLSHDFGGGLSASLDGVFARGLDQYVVRDVNFDRDIALSANRIVRLNPNYSAINRVADEGRFNYRALHMSGRFAPNARHLVRLSYTLSKNESNTRTALEGAGGNNIFGATNPFNYDEDYGPTDNDIRHNMTTNWVTLLPAGIRISGILSARSALPWSVTTPQQLDGDPFADRPEPRNSRRGDRVFSLDLRLAKVFGFGTRRSATAFIEMFNATNATNLGGYVGTLGAAEFGRPTTGLEKRRTQLGFRIDF